MSQSTLLDKRPTTARPLAAQPRWRARVLLSALGVLLPLVLLEVVLRVAGPVFPGTYQLGTLMVADSRYGH